MTVLAAWLLAAAGDTTQQALAISGAGAMFVLIGVLVKQTTQQGGGWRDVLAAQKERAETAETALAAEKVLHAASEAKAALLAVAAEEARHHLAEERATSDELRRQLSLARCPPEGET